MRIPTFIFGSLCALSTALASPAADHPDFSGTWSSEGVRDGADAYHELGSGWGVRITIAQQGDRLVVTYPFFARGDMQPPVELNYSTDGVATQNRVMMGRGVQMQTSTARWNDGRLVITTRYSFELDGDRVMSEVVQRLWLDSPATLIVETTRGVALGGGVTTNQTTYRKL